MIDKTPDISDQIAMLRQAYLDKLPEKIAELDAVLASIKPDGLAGENQVALQDVAARAHKFAGSAGLYGLGDISEHARTLESQCLLIDGENGSLQPYELDGLRREVEFIKKVALNAHEVAHDQSDLIAQSHAVSGTASTHQSIMIADSDAQAAHDIAEMLEDLGYATHIVVEASKMESALSVISPDAVIMGGNFDQSGAGETGIVHRLRNKGHLLCPVLFWSEQEDFATRMRAVRAGSDAFLTKPADAFELMEALNQILSRNVTNPLRVLLVDDDDEVIDYLKLVLTEAGFVARTQANASMVLDDVYDFHPDIVLLDIAMPECDGFEMAQLIRQTKDYSNVPIVFLTTYPAEEKRLLALEYGGDDYIQKNVRAPELISAVLSRAERSRSMSTLLSTLRASEERSRIVSYTGGESIICINDAGRIILWNNAASQTFGYDEKEIVGRSIADLVSDEDGAALVERATSGRGGSSNDMAAATSEYQCVRAKGEVFPGEISVAHWQQFGRQFSTIIVRDVSSTTHARQELERRVDQRTSELHLRDEAINSTSVGIVIVNAEEPDHPIEYVNRAFERMTGYPYGDVIGRNARFLQGEDRDQANIATLKEAISARKPARVTLRNYRKDGTLFWNELQVTPVWADDKLTHFVGVLDDVTTKRETDELLHQAQKMEAVGQLTGGIAHDFNNLLAVTVNSLQLLQRQGGLRREDEELIDEALAATNRSMELTKQLLAFSRRHTLESQAAELSRLISGTQRMLRRTLGETLELKLDLEDEAWLTQIDPALLESAIVNLTINARDAMSSGGKLTIRTKNILASQIASEGQAALENCDYVVVEVADTGKGMPEDVQERIFDPFYTTKEVGEGTGLGLSMTHGFVMQSGGHIMVDSMEGVGTTFRLYFPRVAEAAAPKVVDEAPAPIAPTPPQQESEPDFDVAGKTILLVEDEPLVRGTVLRVLSELGYDVIEMETGRDAVAFLEEPENCDKISLILSDVVMPGGVSGPELAEFARTKVPDMRILLTSGYMGENLPDGVNYELLPKPFDMKTLSQKIEQLLV